MAKKVEEAIQVDEGALLRERVRYRAWMTVLFWSGLAFGLLKEWRHATWEDVAGAWSTVGAAAYLYLKYRPPQAGELPSKSPSWRTWPMYGVGGGLVVLALLQFLGGRPGTDHPNSSLRWIVHLLDRWNLMPDGDWLGLALTILLLATLVTREECLSSTSAK